MDHPSPNRTLRFIFRCLKNYWRRTLLGIGLLIATNAIGVIIPLRIKETVDSYTEGGAASGVIWRGIGTIALLAVLMAIVRTCSRVAIFSIGRQVESAQKQDFYEHLLSLDTQYFHTQKVGDLISRATSDIQAVRQMMGFGLLNVINIIWAASFTLPLLFSLSVSLTWWIMLGYIPIFFLVKVLSEKLKAQQKLAQEELGNLSSFIEEDINGVQVIKAYSQEKREIQRFHEMNAHFTDISVKLARWRSLVWPIMEFAGSIGFFILVVYASFQLLEAGTLAAYLVALGRLIFPIAITGWLITIFQRGSVSVRRLQDIYEVQPSISLEEEAKSTSWPREDTVSITVDNLSFCYRSSEEEVLRDLSMHIPGGSFVGLVGTVGSGKSTFCQLLPRLLPVPKGNIYLGGADVNAYSLIELRRHVSLVPQEPFLFNATIRENISFAGEYSRENIDRAAKLCCLEEEIGQLPEGYETVVGEKGVTLSGGQAQRLTLARNVLLAPEVLILDDALSSVDNEIGLRILRGIREHFPKQTLILTTHRPSSLRKADYIFVFSRGRCLASGTHQELQTNSLYSQLCKEQNLASSKS